MAERLGGSSRHKDMRNLLLGVVLTLPLVLAGCGTQGVDDERSARSPSVTACRGDQGPVRLADADLDGDGRADVVSYLPPSGRCPAGLTSSVPGLEESPSLEWDAPPTSAGAKVVKVPGRDGELVLLTEQHPRGGFHAHLYGYADGKLEELTVDGSPIFSFVATDALTDPTSAACVDGGFEVVHARAHQPIGVVPAWDIDRTTYTVDGNTITKGATREVADNVLDEQLHKKYTDLVHYRLFENCRAAAQ